MSKTKYLGIFLLGSIIASIAGNSFFELPEYLGIAVATTGMLGLSGWIRIPKNSQNIK